MAELNFRKRGKTWEYRFETASINGKRNQVSKSGFKTKAECAAAGTKALNEYNNAGSIFRPNETSFSDFLDYWMENYAKGLAYNTYIGYESKVRIHIKPYLGAYKLTALADKPDVIQKWINERKDTGMAKSMVKNLLACVSGAFNYAIAPCKFIRYNPCTLVKIGKIPINLKAKEHTDYIIPKDEYSRISARFEHDAKFLLPLAIGYNIGSRISETYGLLIEDIDLVNLEIKIQRQISKVEKQWCYKPPKYESYRTVEIGNTLKELLRKEIIQKKENRLFYGKYYMKSYLGPNNNIIQMRADIELPYSEIHPLITKEDGSLQTPESFKYCARVIHNELNNPLFHSHALRHTHGTILAENGVNPKTVMERLGHKDVNTTLQVYTFNTEKMQRESVHLFEKAVHE
jgi:Site-specific recombinase XerD